MLSYWTEHTKLICIYILSIYWTGNRQKDEKGEIEQRRIDTYFLGCQWMCLYVSHTHKTIPSCFLQYCEFVVSVRYLPRLHHIQLLLDCDSIIDAVMFSAFYSISHGFLVIPLCMCCFDAIYLHTRRWLLSTVSSLDRNQRYTRKTYTIDCETFDKYTHSIESNGTLFFGAKQFMPNFYDCDLLMLCIFYMKKRTNKFVLQKNGMCVEKFKNKFV